MLIKLNNIRIHARHGVMPDERTIGAWFGVSLTVETDFLRALNDDELSGTVSYADLAEIIKEEMLIPSQLLEHVAGRIARRLMQEFPTIARLTIEVSKENPPICLECQSSSVVVSFDRNGVIR